MSIYSNFPQAREAVVNLVKSASPQFRGWRIPGHNLDPLATALMTKDEHALYRLRESNNPLLSFVVEQLLNTITELVPQETKTDLLLDAITKLVEQREEATSKAPQWVKSNAETDDERVVDEDQED